MTVRVAACVLLLILLSACASPRDYWGQQIAALPAWEAFRCRQALQQVDVPMIKAFCPAGIPYP